MNINIGIILLVLFSYSCNTIIPPEDMVYFKGGSIIIGSDKGLPNEWPPFKKNIKPFFIDKNLVTVDQFRNFVRKTGYITEAEKFGNSGTFDFIEKKWKLTDGAYWEYPLGPDGPKAKNDHPVTQVSWNDAIAYANWINKRLPHEFEWEYAAKGGNNINNKYSWGTKLMDNNIYKANVWTGNFPMYNTGADKFILTSPVGYFGENEYGMNDMGGNVWEWCSNTYNLYKGNNNPFDYDENVKVLKGGSFMCDSNVCHGYRISARMYNSVETGLFHQGFRCAKDAN